MNEPIETAEMLAFTKSIEAKSLSRAAAELGVPRATLSRRLGRLEEALGVRLLRRTTRSLALTDAGEAFYRHARIALDAVTQAEESVRTLGTVVQGPLRVSVPPLTDPSFHAFVCDFAARYPEVRLHLQFSTQHVDLIRDGYDAAIRASSQLEPGLVARTLARGEMLAVASPAYLAAHGAPRSVEELLRHRCLLGFARGELPQTHWPLAGGAKLRVQGSFLSNDITMLCAAALNGLGIALLPRMILEAHLASGALVPVLPGQILGETRISIVFPERELVPPQVRAFVDAMIAWSPSPFGGVRGAPSGAVRSASPEAPVGASGPRKAAAKAAPAKAAPAKAGKVAKGRRKS